MSTGLSIGITLLLSFSWLFTWGTIVESNPSFSFLRKALFSLLAACTLIEVCFLRHYSFLLLSSCLSLWSFFSPVYRLPDDFALETGTTLKIFIAAAIKTVLIFIGLPAFTAPLLAAAWLYPASYLLALPLLEPVNGSSFRGSRKSLASELSALFTQLTKNAQPKLAKL